MICVYDIGNENYTANGDAILTPTECKVKMVAGGQYNLNMTHPIDPWGKWEHLVPEAILKVPIPEEVIESAISGLDVDVYVTNTTATMYEGPNAPQRIYYPQFQFSGVTYVVGSKVSYVGHNWQMHTLDPQSEMGYNHPPNNYPEYWRRIADYTTGDPVLATFNPGTEVYLIEDAGDGWYHVMTAYGLTGYMQASQLTYDHHITPAETGPRIIREQLFRIRTADRNTKQNRVTVTAEHVSYDLAGVMVEGVDLSQVSPAMAIYWIRNGFMTDYRGNIATNLTDPDDGTYTGKVNGKNAIFAYMDPDQGIVKHFDAELRRDNWDLYVMRKTEENRGFRLAYGKNTTGVNWSQKTDQLVTRVVPVAKDEDGNDFFLDPVKWVDSEHIGEYPVIRMEWLRVQGQVGKDDGTESGTNWTEETLRAEMQARAEARFNVDHADLAEQEVTIDFEMLGDTEEHRQMQGLETVLLYDLVEATDERIGLTATLEVSELEFDAIREKISALKLTNVNTLSRRSVSGFSVVDRSIGQRKLMDEVLFDIPKAAKEEAIGTSWNYTDNRITALMNWIEEHYQVIDRLDSTSATAALSANMGRVLNENKAERKIYNSKSAFPATGAANVLYIAADSETLYYWDGNDYIEIGGSGGGSYTLPLANNGTRGGVQVGYTQSGNNYPVALSSEKMYVNVPTMGGATAQADGTKGLAPAPAAGKNGQFLRGDATWASALNTMITASDCDTVDQPGLYRIADTTANRPCNWGVLFHMVAVDYKTQIAINIADVPQIYRRKLLQGVWSNWECNVRSISTGSANGTISVNKDGSNTDVAVKGLNNAAYKDLTDNSSAAALGSSDAKVPTVRTVRNSYYNALDQTAAGYALDARQGRTLQNSITTLEEQKANLNDFTRNVTANTLTDLQTAIKAVWDVMADGHTFIGHCRPNFTDETMGFNGSDGIIIYSKRTSGDYVAYLFLGGDVIICDYYYSAAHHWTHGDLYRKASRYGTSWGTYVTAICPHKQALILVNQTTKIQVQLGGTTTVSIGVEHNDGTGITAYTAYDTSGTISFGKTSPTGSDFRIIRTETSISFTATDNATITILS